MDDTDLPDFANIVSGKLFSIDSTQTTKEYKELWFSYNLETEIIKSIDDIHLLTKIEEKEIIFVIANDDPGRHYFEGLYAWLYVTMYNSLPFLKLKKLDSFDYKQQSVDLGDYHRTVVYFILSSELSLLAKLDPTFVSYIELNAKIIHLLNSKRKIPGFFAKFFNRDYKKRTAGFLITHTAFFSSEQRSSPVAQISSVDYRHMKEITEIE